MRAGSDWSTLYHTKNDYIDAFVYIDAVVMPEPAPPEYHGLYVIPHLVPAVALHARPLYVQPTHVQAVLCLIQQRLGYVGVEVQPLP